MRVNPLPPQAYTKETLQKAYAWLLTQNSSVKEMAQDQNILVSLYLKALRGGEGALETPSIQNFKQELKSLASMMGDFQSQEQEPSATVTSHPTNALSHQSQANQTQAPENVRHEKQHPNFMLDAKSMASINEVRETFNLGSDIEAIRVLIALGIKQFKKINN